ncbi:hypothetical protein [Eleftheria terrae]|uniref:hypothetical protein n=1 Tax=Eleftheria terrae TaxID=1597781 RepID=UPI00263B8B1E|nr:hypothetical protein [Eleftheria terrae]WKB55793.1 hypothetical protein N7L95_27305 [Eleftheria terrae]
MKIDYSASVPRHVPPPGTGPAGRTGTTGSARSATPTAPAPGAGHDTPLNALPRRSVPPGSETPCERPRVELPVTPATRDAAAATGALRPDRLEFDQKTLNLEEGARFKGGERPRHPGGERYAVLSYVQPGTGKAPVEVTGLMQAGGHKFDVFNHETHAKIGELAVVCTASGGSASKVGVDPKEATLKGGMPRGGRIVIRESQTSATGYRLDNGLPCSRDGRPTVRQSQTSATGYRTTGGLPCDANGYATVRESRASVTGFKTASGVPCNADGHPVLRESRLSVTGFKNTQGLACDADGHPVMHTSSSSATGFRLKGGAPCDVDGHPVLRESRASVTGLKNLQGMACDADGHAVMHTSSTSVTGFRTSAGRPCTADGHPVTRDSDTSATKFRTLDGVPCDGNGAPVRHESASSATGFRSSNGLPCDADGFETVIRSNSSVTGFRLQNGLACDGDGHPQVFASAISPTGFQHLNGAPCNAAGSAVPGITAADLDKNRPQRLDCPPAPAHALYPKRVAMMAQYSGEETGRVWGTQVAYLNRSERRATKLTIDSSSGLIYDAAGQLFDTRHGGTGLERGHAIFVMDHNGELYASCDNVVGKFHHSSFLAGAPVAGAGTMKVINGQLQELTRRSGHYRPTEGQHHQVVDNLLRQGVSHFNSRLDV